MKKINKTTIQQALLALTSSILTEAIIKQLFPDNYSGTFLDGSITIYEISTMSMWTRVFSLVLLFLIIWTILSIILPCLEALASRFKYKRKLIHSRKEIIALYFSSKKKIQQIVIESNMEKAKLAMYYVDIAICINSMYRYFCSKSSSAQRVVLSAFRKSESVSDIDRYISFYDYLHFVKLLGTMLECILRCPTAADAELNGRGAA